MQEQCYTNLSDTQHVVPWILDACEPLSEHDLERVATTKHTPIIGIGQTMVYSTQLCVCCAKYRDEQYQTSDIRLRMAVEQLDMCRGHGHAPGL
jgi:hypothetical protein